MNRLVLLLVFVLAALSVFAGTGSGQMYRGWTQEQYSKLYDPRSVQTVRGQVIGINEVAPFEGKTPGIDITLRPEGGGPQIIVHVGPNWFVTREDFPLRLHEIIEVTGSLVTFEGTPTMIASNIKAAGRTYTFRDMKTGMPEWSGQGR